ncbi:hypothetical protein FACHB389_25320 [Nostoc calcicola FACHB-389]|nr:hypothetical protein [Nostoc calcicola FACHB-3891]OKH29901.1 hypothetical protein FACHB389_25320 [Nostoc calcicola FACHB-389]
MYSQAISALFEAADNFNHANLVGNDFAKLGLEDGQLMLGWVQLPTWENIQLALHKILSTQFISDRTHFLFCGTGGWIHAVNVVRELGCSSNQQKVIGLHSLNPSELAVLLQHEFDLQQTTCIGISLTRTTLETCLLMENLQKYFALAGLNFEEHFIWLTSILAGQKSSEIEHHFSLTVSGRADVGALFSAPCTLAILLPMVLLLKEEIFAHSYQQLLVNQERLLDKMAKRAYEISQYPGSALWFRTEGKRQSSLERWILQLTRQALGSKTPYSPANILLGQDIAPPEFEIIELDKFSGDTPLARAMQAMYACQIFVACLAYWWKIPFVTHPEVQQYKKLVPELLNSVGKTPPFEISLVEDADVTSLESVLIEQLQLQIKYQFVEIVLYPGLTLDIRQKLEESLSFQTKHHCRVYEGSDWNHHSFQFAIANQQTLVIIVEIVTSFDPLSDFWTNTIERHTGMLQSIARATHIALGKSSLFIQWRL